MNKTLCTLLSAAATVGTAFAQSPTLAADINTDGSGYDSNCDGGFTAYNFGTETDSFVQLGGYWYFTAQSQATGDELWRTDGTAAGTSLVMDINPGSASSSPDKLVEYYGVGIFFSADDGVNGRELWFTNGVTTAMVKDINPGSASSTPNYLKVFNGFLYLQANDGTNGAELWISDTTAGGTNMLVDIRPSASGNPQQFAEVAGGTKMVFKANDGTTGGEIWVTDGTAAGTGLLLDTRPGTLTGVNLSPKMATFAGEVYFLANDGVVGEELWKTDGTPAGTVMVADINGTSGSSSINLDWATEFNGYLYFRATGATGGSELYRTDGTALGTTLHWDSNTSTATSGGFADYFRHHGGELYFRAIVNDGVTNYGSYELCKLDAAGTPSLVLDFNPGTGGAMGASPDLFSFNGKLFFTGTDGTTGTELCAFDAAGPSAAVVKDIEAGATGSNPDWFTPINATQMIFTADTALQGTELWITDGTTAGTNLLVEIDAAVFTIDSDPAGLTSLNGKDLFFTAKIPGGTGNEELCKWEPGVGVTIVKDIRPGDSGSAIDEADWTYARFGGQDVLVFTANDGSTGNELFVSDGTAAGTNVIVDLYPGTSSGSTGDTLVFYKGRVYFEGTDGPAPGSATGNELWATDGTAAGTVLVADINPSGASGILMFPGTPIYNGELYFRANDGTNGAELWKTDGTAAGTVMVADINPGSGSSNPNYPVIYNGMLLFQANDGTNGAELWMTDGTAAGTVLLADLQAGSFGSSAMGFGGTAELGGWLYFRADGNDGVNDYGFELFRTNLVTTELVADVNPGSANGSPGNIHRVGNQVLFVATDATTGGELWATDGTTTAQVLDINPGTASGITATDIRVDSIAVGTGIYFEADDGVNGDELWFSDGTAAGTYMVADINPFGDSNATSYGVANGQLFFAAGDGALGEELWTIASPGASASWIGHTGDGSRLTCTPPVMGQPWEYSFQQAPSFGATMPAGGISIGSVRIWGNALDTSFAAPGITDADSSIWVDLALAPVVLEFNPLPAGVGGFVMPSSPAYLGLRINVQSVTLRTTVLPFGASNGVALYLGN